MDDNKVIVSIDECGFGSKPLLLYGYALKN